MKQSQILIKQLKKILRTQGITYSSLAQKLGISESSVKRIFSNESFTLNRLEEICSIVDLSVSDLVKISMRQSWEEHSHLNWEQEQGLAKNERLFTYFYLLISGMNITEILKNYQFSATESTRFLLLMDRMKLIEYHSDKRVRLLISRNFTWIKNGPLILEYENKIKEEFLQSSFSNSGEFLQFLSGYFSDVDLKIFHKKISKLIGSFKESVENQIPHKSDKYISMLVAYRPWVFSVISKYKR